MSYLLPSVLFFSLESFNDFYSVVLCCPPVVYRETTPKFMVADLCSQEHVICVVKREEKENREHIVCPVQARLSMEAFKEFV